MSSFDLQELLLRAKEGDREALGVIFQRYSPFLLQIANEELDPRLRQKTGGSDLVQQTLMEAGQSIAAFEGTSTAFIAWLRKILLNNIANQRRHFHAEKRSLDREVRLSPDGSAGMRIDQLEQGNSTRSDKLERQETLDAVSESMAGLTDDYRRVISYRNQQKLSFQEIGQLMERSEEAARKLWARAIETLKAELDRRQP